MMISSTSGYWSAISVTDLQCNKSSLTAHEVLITHHQCKTLGVDCNSNGTLPNYPLSSTPPHPQKIQKNRSWWEVFHTLHQIIFFFLCRNCCCLFEIARFFLGLFVKWNHNGTHDWLEIFVDSHFSWSKSAATVN